MPPTPKQLAFLKHMGLESPETLTPDGASKSIENLESLIVGGGGKEAARRYHSRLDAWNRRDKYMLHAELYQDDPKVNNFVFDELPEIMRDRLRRRRKYSKSRLERGDAKKAVASLRARIPLWWARPDADKLFEGEVAHLKPEAVEKGLPPRRTRIAMRWDSLLKGRIPSGVTPGDVAAIAKAARDWDWDSLAGDRKALADGLAELTAAEDMALAEKIRTLGHLEILSVLDSAEKSRTPP